MISVCMIVKDESEILDNTLKSISKYGYEIIIVDTGSTDNTKEIAYKYTNKVYDYKWENDFSKARNFAISKANNENILVLDADEIVLNVDKKLLEKTICKDKVGRINIVNKYSNSGENFESREKISRFFCKNLFKYEGIIHEQIVSTSGEKYLTYDIPVTIEHIGYEENELGRKEKIKRNIKLLEIELENKGLDPYVLYQLGKCYYVEKDYEIAERYFNQVINFDLDTNLEYVQDMIECYGYTLINQDKCKEAMELLGVYSEFSNCADFVFLVGHIYMNNGYFDKAIDEFEKAKKYKTCKTKGVNDYLANYNIGLILECLGNTEEAIKYYKKCKDYKLAKERMKLL